AGPSFSDSCMSPTVRLARYGDIGSAASQRNVERSAASVRSTSRPPATASNPAGTVAVTLTIALSDGWSLDGNQVAAPIGSAITVDQSSPRSTHPPSPMSPPVGDELPVRPGDPEYVTTTVVVSPSESWRSGVTTI